MLPDLTNRNHESRLPCAGDCEFFGRAGIFVLQDLQVGGFSR